MNTVNAPVSDQLLKLLLDATLYDRPPLLVARLTELLITLPRREVVSFFKAELIDADRPLPFQHALVEAAANLPWTELQQPLSRYILSPAPIQLIKGAMRALAASRRLSAYRFFRELSNKCSRPEIAELARGQIDFMLRENPVIHRFHALLNGQPAHRDPFTGLAALAAELDADSRKLLLLPLQQLPNSELTALARLIALCGDRFFAGPLLKRLQLDWLNFPDRTQKELLAALVVCVRSSGKAERVGQALDKLFHLTPEKRRDRVLIWTWPLLDETGKARLLDRFWHLTAEDRRALIEGIGDQEAARLTPLLLAGLEREDDDIMFEDYVAWLLLHQGGRVCLDRLDGLPPARRHLLLSQLCQGDCQDYVDDLLPLFHAGEADDILVCLAGGLLRTSSPAAAARAWELMSSGVSESVLSALIRRLPDWLPRTDLTLDAVFAVCRRETGLLVEWLVAWGRILEKATAPQTRLALLEGVLVLFEDRTGVELVHFVEFFRRMVLHTREEWLLVCLELRMILNTLLKSPLPAEETRRLAEFLRDLERQESKWGRP
jgi:hypothetical protein